MVTCCVKGPELAKQLAKDVVWIPEVDPGFILSHACGRPWPISSKPPAEIAPARC